jgi:Acetamidase/Formamidase family
LILSDAAAGQPSCPASGPAPAGGCSRAAYRNNNADPTRAAGHPGLQYFRDDYFTPPELAAPRRFFAITGIGVHKDGTNESEDLSLSAKNALLNMIEHLETRGFDRQQAYALCSVAVDLRISQVVDVPNLLVSALLPLDIFM